MHLTHCVSFVSFVSLRADSQSCAACDCNVRTCPTWRPACDCNVPDMAPDMRLQRGKAPCYRVSLVLRIVHSTLRMRLPHAPRPRHRAWSHAPNRIPQTLPKLVSPRSGPRAAPDRRRGGSSGRWLGVSSGRWNLGVSAAGRDGGFGGWRSPCVEVEMRRLQPAGRLTNPWRSFRSFRGGGRLATSLDDGRAGTLLLLPLAFVGGHPTRWQRLRHGHGQRRRVHKRGEATYA